MTSSADGLRRRVRNMVVLHPSLKSQTGLAATHHPYAVSGINSQTHFINQILITMLYTLRAPYMLVHYHHHFILREVKSAAFAILIGARQSFWRANFIMYCLPWLSTSVRELLVRYHSPLIVSHQGSNPNLFTIPFHLLLRTAFHGLYTLYSNMFFCFTVFTFLVFVFYWLLAVRLSWFPVSFERMLI